MPQEKDIADSPTAARRERPKKIKMLLQKT